MLNTAMQICDFFGSMQRMYFSAHYYSTFLKYVKKNSKNHFSHMTKTQAFHF